MIVRQTRPLMNEADLLTAVLDMAAIFGWEAAHFRPALTSRGWRTPVQGTLGKGFPDLVLARPMDKRLLLVELKRDAGKLSADQERVLAALARCAPVIVWRPRDLDSGAIERMLR